MSWEVVLGLEIHAQLSTKSKIFSGASTAYGAEPNTQACAVDLGFPGVLPVLNKEAVRMATKFGLAVNAEIGKRNVFDRKNYFYPDLPKGYQTSQMDYPIVGVGELEIEFENAKGELVTKQIGITRAHLEEDAGKSLHDQISGSTGIDLNRAGTPLLEIVSEPDMRSAKEAVAYMRKIHSLVQYIGICDGNMQEGSFRCDVNVSLRRPGAPEYGTRAEIKNINSFRFVEQAIAVEVERQADILESGGTVVQETRLFNPDLGETKSMRSKEDANDYRYFPCPDLLPVELEDSFIEAVRAELPELPDVKKARYMSELGLPAYDAGVLTANKQIADYFEAVIAAGADVKLAANWVNGELAATLNKAEVEIQSSPVTAELLAGILIRISDDTISGTAAKKVFEAVWAGQGDADSVIEAKGLKQITDTGAIEKIIDDIIANNEKQVDGYRAAPADKRGKMIGFFVGQVMKASQGKANPGQVNKLLKQKLEG
jgi:aspartyl-tRNA(Asn)/glutamyl-tRNA(Gln) amidotransferase subunit B